MKFTAAALALLLFTLMMNVPIDAQSQPKPYFANATAAKFAHVNNIKLYYEIYGPAESKSAEPLVLLHGNGGSIAAFSGQIPELAKHFKVIAIDSRAQGRSTDDPAAEITYALMASDVSALISQLHLGAVNVLGWSDGGNIGLELAIAHPEQLKKLVTFGANYTHVDYEAAPDNFKMPPDDPRMANTKAAIAVAEKLQGPPHTEAVQKKLSDLMEKYPNITLDQLHQIQTPVLIVAGDHDLIKMEQSVSLFRNLPHSRLWIVPGATHFVLMEQPEVANRVIIDFLSKPYGDISAGYWINLLPQR